jgi:predicted dinucleotide-binding enzyme
MRIAIICAGSIGTTLGRAWIKHGEDVILGLRNSMSRLTRLFPPLVGEVHGTTSVTGGIPECPKQGRPTARGK